MSREAQTRIEQARVTGATALDLSGLGLTAIPSELGRLTGLGQLDLRNNQITEIPESLALLTGLSVLYLDGNGIREIPDHLAKLTKLVILSLDDNQIKTIPDFVFALPVLRFLDLSDNAIDKIPHSIANAGGLRNLYLAKNRISVLPDPLPQLPNLEVLYLYSNSINALPDSWTALPKLKNLVVFINQIATIPQSLAELPDLEKVDLRWNPLPPELAELADQGWPALRAYLQARAQSSQRNWRAKLMLVGEGGVGKTNLLRGLRNEPFIPKLDPTHSLEIRELPLPHPSLPDTTLDFRAWDLGGQDFYHATHQFFYTGKSIFLLVWKARESMQLGTLTDWLDRIVALAPDAPIFLVATWCDSVQPNIPIAELKEKYPQIVDLFPTDNASGLGIDTLRQHIIQVALEKLDHLGQPRPTTWINGTDAVRNHPDNYVEFSAFRHLIESSGVKEPDIFIEHLCRTGDVTFFPKNPIYSRELAELNDWVVLKPDWLLQRVSDVITNAEVSATRGVLTHQQQAAIWHDLPNIVQEYLLRLMDHFDLAYRTESAPIRSIVVELAQEDRPPGVNEAWDLAAATPNTGEVALEYHFKTTIPPGLPTWFVVRSHRFTTPELHWRRGALLVDGPEKRHTALIHAGLDGKFVRLAVRGPVPQNFFALLRDCFEGTLRRFPGLHNKVSRVVPCPNCTGSFPLEGLELYLAEGDTDIRCTTCRTKRAIASLLFGIHPSGMQAVLDELALVRREASQRHHELLALLQREFIDLFHREQSNTDSHCPSVFTLEFLRTPHLNDDPYPARLCLFCEQPGAWHETRAYQITPTVSAVAPLAPLMKKLSPLFAVAGPILGLAYPPAKLIGDAGKEFTKWAGEQPADKLTPLLQEVGESRFEREAGPMALFALRRLLDAAAPAEKDCWGGLRKVLTKQFHYLWLCEEHAKLHEPGSRV
jgi:GTPase SAR1 family protein